jgi:hypothetical protein
MILIMKCKLPLQCFTLINKHYHLACRYKIQSATIEISAPDVTSNEIINATAMNTIITIWYNNNTGTLYLAGSASTETYQRILSSATYFIRFEETMMHKYCGILCCD